jgi:DNA-binding CsgD family transcriptional regulator
VKQHLAGAPVVLLSDRDDVEDVTNALSQGIRGYINLSVEPEVVFAALKLVDAGGTFIPAHAIGSTATNVHNLSTCRRQQVMTALDLTPRELGVIELLREGKPNKLIAAALRMQESTVKVHVRNIMKKLHVASRTHAASVANRLLDQPNPAIGSLPASRGSNGGGRLLTAQAEAQRQVDERITVYFGALLVNPIPACRSTRTPRPRIEDAPKLRIDCTELDPFRVTPSIVTS